MQLLFFCVYVGVNMGLKFAGEPSRAERDRLSSAAGCPQLSDGENHIGQRQRGTFVVYSLGAGGGHRLPHVFPSAAEEDAGGAGEGPGAHAAEPEGGILIGILERKERVYNPRWNLYENNRRNVVD